MRSNPRITLDDAEAVRTFSDNITAVAAQGNSSARDHLRRGVARSRQPPRRLAGLSVLPDVRVERGRLISPTEIDRNQPGHRPRLGDRRAAVRPQRSARQGHQDCAGCTSGSSASARRRDRSSASRRTSSRSCRSARSQDVRVAVRPAVPGQAAHARPGTTGDGRRHRRACASSGGCGRRNPTTSGCSPRRRCSTSTGRRPPAFSRCSSASSPSRSSSAASSS